MHNLTSSRLDDYNVLQSGLPKKVMSLLQMIHNHIAEQDLQARLETFEIFMGVYGFVCLSPLW